MTMYTVTRKVLNLTRNAGVGPGPAREAVEEEHALAALRSREAAVEGETVSLHLEKQRFERVSSRTIRLYQATECIYNTF